MLTLGRLCHAFTSVWFAGEEPIDLQARWDRGSCAQANCALDVILCTSRYAQDDFNLHYCLQVKTWYERACLDSQLWACP